MRRRPAPSWVLYKDMCAAATGVPPEHAVDDVLRLTGLDSEEPDGRDMADRLLGEGSAVSSMLGLLLFVRQSRRLIEATNRYIANPEQEQVARSIGALVSRHVMRENQACDTVAALVERSERLDLIPPAVRDRIHEIQQNELDAD